MKSSKQNDIFIQKILSKGTVSSEIKSFSNNPDFIKKAEEAKKIIDRVGFPKELITK